MIVEFEEGHGLGIESLGVGMIPPGGLTAVLVTVKSSLPIERRNQKSRRDADATKDNTVRQKQRQRCRAEAWRYERRVIARAAVRDTVHVSRFVVGGESGRCREKTSDPDSSVARCADIFGRGDHEVRVYVDEPELYRHAFQNNSGAGN